MPQLHLYVSKELAQKVKEQADNEVKTVSQFLADLVKREVADEWPSDFRERLLGGWEGEPLVRPEQPPEESREALRFPESDEFTELQPED